MTLNRVIKIWPNSLRPKPKNLSINSCENTLTALVCYKYIKHSGNEDFICFFPGNKIKRGEITLKYCLESWGTHLHFISESSQTLHI